MPESATCAQPAQQRSTPEKPTILVTDAGRGCSIAIIRSLGRRGWRVIAADCHGRSLGFRSRYAQRSLIYPSPESAPRRFVAAMLEAAREHEIDLIIPVTDACILPLSQWRSEFDDLCQVTLPTVEALDVATNKHKTQELAERLGVPVPRTRLVHTVDEALRHGPALGWPLVLKPQVSRLYRESEGIESMAVCYAEHRDHLAEQMRRFEGRCGVLLQEYYRGRGHGVELLLQDGQPLAAFQHERLREVPLNGGPSALRRSVPLDPVLYDHSVRLLSALRWTGLAMVEFKVGGDGPRLMEINGRVWGSLPLAIHSGMDFPGRLADMWLFGAQNREAAPDSSYRVGVRARNLELDLMWIVSVLWGRKKIPFLSMPKRYEALAALFELLNPAFKFDILSWDDPRPGMAELRKIAGKFFTKVKQSE